MTSRTPGIASTARCIMPKLTQLAVWRSRHRSGPVRRLLTNPGVLDIFVAHSTRLWPRITHQLILEPPTRSRAISHARFVHRDRARSIWRYGVELIFSSSRGACRVCPGDIHNAWDRHEPLKPSRTAPRGAWPRKARMACIDLSATGSLRGFA